MLTNLIFLLAFFQTVTTPQQFTDFMNKNFPAQTDRREVPLTTNECRADEWPTPTLHDGKAWCTLVPKVVSTQLILSASQAKLNPKAKPCGPTNHDGACVDVSLRSFVWSTYVKKDACERREGVECTTVNFDCEQRWVPIGKPIVTEEK